jgi:hypothetical protein
MHTINWESYHGPGLSLHKPGCSARPAFVRFITDKVALGGLFPSNLYLHRQHHSNSVRYTFTNISFMFRWPCILIIFVMKTNLMHCLYLIYLVEQPLHVLYRMQQKRLTVLNITGLKNRQVFLPHAVRSGDWQLPVTGTYSTYQLLYMYSGYLLMMGSVYTRNM